MTDDSADLQLGKLVREHTDIRKTIETLMAEARRLAQVYLNVGETLKRFPQNLIFDRESHDGRFHSNFVLKATDIDSKRLLELTNQLRDAIVRRDDIAQNLLALGFDVNKQL